MDADATSFALMRRLRLREALAFDGDFAAAGFIEVRPDVPGPGSGSPQAGEQHGSGRHLAGQTSSVPPSRSSPAKGPSSIE